MPDDPRSLALELERRGKPKTSVDARAAKALREMASERERLRQALGSIENCKHAVQVGRSPFSEACDIARAALREQEGS